jgi:hypothetical protein
LLKRLNPRTRKGRNTPAIESDDARLFRHVPALLSTRGKLELSWAGPEGKVVSTTYPDLLNRYSRHRQFRQIEIGKALSRKRAIGIEPTTFSLGTPEVPNQKR